MLISWRGCLSEPNLLIDGASCPTQSAKANRLDSRRRRGNATAVKLRVPVDARRRRMTMNAVAPVLEVTWEKLPDDYVLDDEPVDNIAQPALAAALNDSLVEAGRLPETALTTTNYGICVTVNGQLVIKAPDWCYVPAIRASQAAVFRSYTPHLEGDAPLIVMEFLSHTPGGEYSRHPRYPYGKMFFYERILQVPHYFIYRLADSRLEAYRLDDLGDYQPRKPNADGRYWIEEMGLFLGVWHGVRDNFSLGWLRWWDRDGRLLLWGSEAAAQERREKERQQQRAEQAEQQIEQERLHAEQERLRAEQAEQQIEHERQRAEQAEQQIEQERREKEQERLEKERQRQRAEQAEQQIEQERQRAEQARRVTISQLLAAGLSAEQVATALGLTVAEVKLAGS